MKHHCFRMNRDRLILHKSNVRDHYHISRDKLGEGSFGIVKRATKISDGSLRALKIIPKRNQKQNTEASVLRLLDHPNVAKLYESFEDKRYDYLVLELCEGEELLDKMIGIGQFNEAYASSIAEQMLQATAHIHHKGVIHRDLKPENFVFLKDSANSPIKLIDFGLATVKYPDAKLSSTTGNCYYIAPEVLKGDYDEKCDVWSLGVILYTMLTGFSPFEGESEAEVLSSIEKAQVDFEAAELKDLSNEAKDLLEKLLEYDPQKRISAAEALKHKWISQNKHPEPVCLNTEDLIQYNKSDSKEKTLMNYFALQASHEEVTEIINNFKALDKSSNGVLSLLDIEKACSDGELLWEDFLELKKLACCSSEISFTSFVAANLQKQLYQDNNFSLTELKTLNH